MIFRKLIRFLSHILFNKRYIYLKILFLLILLILFKIFNVLNDKESNKSSVKSKTLDVPSDNYLQLTIEDSKVSEEEFDHTKTRSQTLLDHQLPAISYYAKELEVSSPEINTNRPIDNSSTIRYNSRLS